MRSGYKVIDRPYIVTGGALLELVIEKPTKMMRVKSAVTKLIDGIIDVVLTVAYYCSYIYLIYIISDLLIGHI